MKTPLLILWILITVNVSAQWTRISNSLAQAHSIYFQSAQTGYVLKNDTIFKTTNGGLSWNQLPNGFHQYTDIRKIRFISPDTGFVYISEGISFAYPVSIYMTENGGQTWHSLIGPYDGSDIEFHLAGQNDWYFHVTAHWLSAPTDSIFHTVNGGNTFTKTGNTTTAQYNQAINNLIVYKDSATSAQKKLFYKSTNGGGTWSLLLTDSTVSAGYADHQFLNSNDGYVLYYQYVSTDNIDSKLYKTTDGGQNWTSYNLPAAISAPQNMCFTDINNGYIISYSSPLNQIFKTSDGGQTWSLDFSGNTNEYFSGEYGIVEYYGNLYVLGNTVLTNHVTTSVRDLKHDAVNFSLYPNPSYGQLTIKTDFSPKNNDFVIMDITGRVVHEFSSGQSGSQTLDVSFLSNGLYLLRHKGTAQCISFVKE